MPYELNQSAIDNSAYAKREAVYRYLQEIGAAARVNDMRGALRLALTATRAIPDEPALHLRVVDVLVQHPSLGGQPMRTEIRDRLQIIEAAADQPYVFRFNNRETKSILSLNKIFSDKQWYDEQLQLLKVGALHFPRDPRFPDLFTKVALRIHKIAPTRQTRGVHLG